MHISIESLKAHVLGFIQEAGHAVEGAEHKVVEAFTDYAHRKEAEAIAKAAQIIRDAGGIVTLPADLAPVVAAAAAPAQQNT